MATRIKFKAGIDYVKKHPTLPLAGGTLVVSSANLATNRNRHNKDREYQEKQLEAMNKLTQSLGKVDKSLRDVSNEEEKKPGLITKFKKKIL